MGVLSIIKALFKKREKHFVTEQELPKPKDLHGKVAMKVGPKTYKKLTHKERMKYHYV